jgi:S-formylglutathione hydrolase FrmB
MQDALRPVQHPRRRGFLRPRRRRGRAVVAVLLAVAVVAATGYVAWGRLHQGPDAAKYGLKEVRFELHSRLLNRTVTEVGVMPPPLPDGKPRPLLVFLHGRGGSAVGQATDGMLAAIGAAGDRAPDVVFADGGDASYYHDRAGGKWGSYVVKEVIPEAVKRLHADPRRVAIAGISMGGFGALDIARLWPGRFCAAAGHSPAMWSTGGETPEGAFDDAEDFAKHDLLGAVAGHDPYGQMRVWIDVGTGDPFHEADAQFAESLQNSGGRVTFHAWPGGHDTAYWSAHLRQYFDFYAHAFAACKVRGSGGSR